MIRVKAKTPGNKRNTATVDSETADPNSENNSDRATTRVNSAPVAVEDRYVMNEDRTLSVRQPGILINDRGPEGEKLEAVLVSKPKHGELRLEKDGSFTYRPDRDYNGADAFEYEACHRSGACSEKATVTITVRAGREN